MSLFQALQWTLLPRFLDIYYHLSVMQGFTDAGGFVTRAFWEFAPEGRPHLYPPLLHVWMWMFHSLGLSPITIGRLVDGLSFPVLLGVWYFVTSRLAGPRAAFWALIFFSSAYSVMLASVTLSAFNLAFVLGLLALLEGERGRALRGALLLALCFYTHTLAAFLFLFAMVLNAILAPEKRTDYLRAAAGGVLLALPILAYQFNFREYFGFVKAKENRRLELDLAVYLLLLPALEFFRTKLRKEPAARWALSLWLGMAPLLITHQIRFVSGHGLAGAAFLAALLLDRNAERVGKAIWGLLLFVLFLAPHFDWNLVTHKKNVVWADRTLTRHLWSRPGQDFRSNAFTIYFPKPYEEIASVIREHSDPDSILWTDFSYTAGILGMMAGRATSCAMLAETKPYDTADRLSAARILVWFRDRDGQASADMQRSAQGRGWHLLKETEMAFIYENPQGGQRRQVPAPLIPSIYLWPLGLFSLLIPALSLLKNPPKDSLNTLKII